MSVDLKALKLLCVDVEEEIRQGIHPLSAAEHFGVHAPAILEHISELERELIEAQREAEEMAANNRRLQERLTECESDARQMSLRTFEYDDEIERLEAELAATREEAERLKVAAQKYVSFDSDDIYPAQLPEWWWRGRDELLAALDSDWVRELPKGSPITAEDIESASRHAATTDPRSIASVKAITERLHAKGIDTRVTRKDDHDK